MGELADRIEALDWDRLRSELDERGYAVAPKVLLAGEATELIGLLEDGSFRSVIDMRRHRFGSGVYKYFDYPLPEPVESCANRSTIRSPNRPTPGPNASLRRSGSRLSSATSSSAATTVGRSAPPR